MIAAGTRHGVKKGQRVVTSAGEFFGVIRDVREEMAMVTSINQRDFSVKVTHAGSVRVIGVTAGGTDTELKVQFIPKTVSLALGELLFAYRELGNPSHIPLGIVKSIESGLDALFQNATLALLTPIPRVTIVSVLSN